MYDAQSFLQMAAGKLEEVTEPLQWMYFSPWISGAGGNWSLNNDEKLHSLVGKLQTSLYKLNSKSVHYTVAYWYCTLLPTEAITSPFKKGTQLGISFAFIYPLEAWMMFCKWDLPSFHYLCVLFISVPPAPVTVPGTLMVLVNVCWLITKAFVMCLWCAFAHSTQECSQTGYKVTLMCVSTLHVPYPSSLGF